MNRYLIRWDNTSVYSITAFPNSGITYIEGYFMATDNLEKAKISLTALDVDCGMIDNEIKNPTINFG